MAQQCKPYGELHARAGATPPPCSFHASTDLLFTASTDEWQQWKWRGPSANMRRIKQVYELEN